ncbi:hypothetical protein [Oceaniglobus ichthyenteri]|uniref:hypothetical protein n=1 Tax=Oceaniglobus ichthyenteri TaxID=2136177 RepID=UPI000D39B58D|nr:hypothetical protein [Oceaniglobus ichthyenteri]
MIGDDLDGHPLHIERPGKEDFVLISARAYSMLLQRIYDLEQNGMTSAEREAEEEELLRAMVDAANSGPLN